MNKQDSNGVRTAQDIERKYDFAKMLGISKNVELNEKSLIKIQNTLNEMLNTLVINLSDVLESQSDVSLWFYSGIPDDTNLPYSGWTNPENHYGDFYYDTNEGKVYKFYEISPYITGTYIYGVHGMWDSIADADLLRAMAITNSEIDTSVDHERKVFLQTPTPPYSSGDWWIKDDGSLFICKLGRETGDFVETDFVNSASYSPTIAESFDDVIQVLKGTVTQLSEDCVRFTDLSTGGSTTIAGENIKSGNIESNNYVSDLSGMKINLTQGTIDTKNFKTDTQGNIYLGTGGKVIGGDGLLSNLIYNAYTRGQMVTGSGDFLPLGRVGGGDTSETQRNDLVFSFDLPDGFTVQEAKIHLFHVPVNWTPVISSAGYSRNLEIYKGSNLNSMKMNFNFNSYSIYATGVTLTKITNGWGSSYPSGFTGSSNAMTNVTSIDIKNYISTTETNYIVIRDSDGTMYSTDLDIFGRTGGVFAYLEILGYKALS